MALEPRGEVILRAADEVDELEVVAGVESTVRRGDGTLRSALESIFASGVSDDPQNLLPGARVCVREDRQGNGQRARRSHKDRHRPE